MEPAPPRLFETVPAGDRADPDVMLDAFLGWVAATGFSPYPAQEEAVLELMADNHVILATPTGSGKSLVALALHYKAICEGRRSFYTSPIKALVSEKFFELCRELGASQVGMLTGDASINPGASVVCCTAEVLANLALRAGSHAPVDYVVMDEFHFYADPDRGIAWQIPLLTLPHATFLLMSATLGDTSEFERRIAEFTGKPVRVIRSEHRPVPLDFEYRETPLHETIHDLAMEGKAPVYVVSFTQRECAELAQDLTSVNLCTKEEKQRIAHETATFRFDTTYGKDIKRFLRHGIGLHHAGLLPRYRTLVERLAQRGVLKIITGTDTLGVGVNVPIRSVLFTKLCKFDGARVRILSVRDFKQISGRAGRRGFDTRGSIVAQAPEHVIENKKLEAKAIGGKKKKFVRKKPPERGYVPWDRATYDKLIGGDPEPLVSTFAITHGLLLSVLKREIDASARDGGYRRVVELIERSYERDGAKRRHRRHAALLFRHLRQTQVIEVVPRAVGSKAAVRLAEDLQQDFSLHHTLSLYLLDALERLDPEAPSYDLDLLSLVEAILEHPHAVLRRQVDKIKTELVAQLKADGVEYEQRMEALEKVEPPKPTAEFVYATFDAFRARHSWLGTDNVRPKSVARDMYERFAGFNEYVGLYGLGRSEGVLLRYLTQAYKTLVQNVPDAYKTDPVVEVQAYLRSMLARVDSSLVREWEAMVAGGDAPIDPLDPAEIVADPLADPRAFSARVRAEMHAVVRALASGDLEEALAASRDDPDPDTEAWTTERLEGALAGFVDECGPLIFDHRARLPTLTHTKTVEPRLVTVQQTLLNAEGPTDWMVEARVDLRTPSEDDGPLVQLVRLGV